MAHPQNRNDTPELRLRCLTEFPPRQGTYPRIVSGFARQALIAACHEGPWWQLDDWHPRCDPRIPLINREPVANYGCSPSQITQPLPLFFRRLLP